MLRSFTLAFVASDTPFVLFSSSLAASFEHTRAVVPHYSYLRPEAHVVPLEVRAKVQTVFRRVRVIY